MTHTTPGTWTPDVLDEINRDFENRSPREILKWALDAFGSGLVMATGFGISGVVLAHQLSRLADDPTVFYLETDLLFEETHELKEELARQLGLTFRPVHSGVSLEAQAAAEGEDLWNTNPDRCCFIRKVDPLRAFLADKAAWISGLRRDQSASRAGTRIVDWDAANGLVKLNPLAVWTRENVLQYIYLYGLPYNRLLDEGYTSVGCTPCTKPAAANGDPRAGRWAGFEKTECGIHLQSTAA